MLRASKKIKCGKLSGMDEVTSKLLKREKLSQNGWLSCLMHVGNRGKVHTQRLSGSMYCSTVKGIKGTALPINDFT